MTADRSEYVRRLAAEIQRGPLSLKYPAVVDLNFAIKVTLEQIEEWDHGQDPHGWCHQRPILITLLAALSTREDQADGR